MYGLNDNIDLSPLTGRTLLQVCTGRFQVRFAFDGEISVSVECCFQVHSQGAFQEWSSGLFENAAAALGLIGMTVTSAKGQRDGTLELGFSGGQRLVIPDASTEYESYTVTMPGKTIVV